MKRHKVILVDDDPILGRHLLYLFSSEGFDLKILYRNRDIKALIDGKIHSDAEFFIIDVMIPFKGLYTKEETHDGCITGVLVARDLRARYADIPIIIWSGVPIRLVRDAAKRASILI